LCKRDTTARGNFPVPGATSVSAAAWQISYAAIEWPINQFHGTRQGRKNYQPFSTDGCLKSEGEIYAEKCDSFSDGSLAARCREFCSSHADRSMPNTPSAATGCELRFTGDEWLV
jgi:hypothetical protein